MGTGNESAALQQQIKALLGKLGWSQNEFARRFHVDVEDEAGWGDETEVRTFQERLKKELQRATTDPQRLGRYLEYLIAHPNARPHLGRSVRNYVRG